MGNSTGYFREYWDCFERLEMTQVPLSSCQMCFTLWVQQFEFVPRYLRLGSWAAALLEAYIVGLCTLSWSNQCVSWTRASCLHVSGHMSRQPVRFLMRLIYPSIPYWLLDQDDLAAAHDIHPVANASLLQRGHVWWHA